MSKVPRPNMPTVPSSVTADTAPRPVSDRLLGERPGRRHASLHRPCRAGSRERGDRRALAHSPPARPAVDNIEGSRVAIVGFEYLTYRSPESSAEERVNIRITDVHPE